MGGPHDSETSERDAVQSAACRTELITELKASAPVGLAELPDSTLARLRALTTQLVELEHASALREYRRFEAVFRRGLDLPADRLCEQLEGRTVLVTGGTGCIGSTLLHELERFRPGRVVSISRGVTDAKRHHAATEYRTADVRDREALRQVFEDVRPDVVYHLAAQHDPGLAEIEVARTLTTNVFGTRNVLEAAQAVGVRLAVYASTGKALRPFTADVYAASKKVGEWMLSDAASRGTTRMAGVRFTHVVDNSIIHNRVRSWISSGSPIRLHGPEIYFYMQSALESAHLLLNAGLDAESDAAPLPGTGAVRMHAIRCLDLPINLTDLALGVVASTGTPSTIYFCGYDAGYEETPYPGLYDPMYAGDLSPLISAVEAPLTEPSTGCEQVDCFPMSIPTTAELQEAADRLEAACADGTDPAVLKDLCEDVSWELLDARLTTIPRDILQRAAKRIARDPSDANDIECHRRTNDAVHRAITARG